MEPHEISREAHLLGVAPGLAEEDIAALTHLSQADFARVLKALHQARSDTLARQKIRIELWPEQIETAVYGLRGAAIRQEQEQEQEQEQDDEPPPFLTGKVPVHKVSDIQAPEYDPWPSDMELAGELEKYLPADPAASA